MIRRQRGFALLIVLWTVGFLALLATRIVAAGRSDTRLSDNLKQEAVLAAAADGAVADVMFTMLAAHDPHILPDGRQRQVRIGQTMVLVRIENESDRINLNRASQALLRALIVGVGTSPAVAERLAAAIVDWRNEGTNTQGQQYRAAGLPYKPPETPFQSLDELADVLGMTPALYERLASHLTVLTRDDPDTNTRDPIVAWALTDASGMAGVADGLRPPDDDAVLRIVATAVGPGNARYAMVVVASANFHSPAPQVSILLRERISRDIDDTLIVAGF